MGKYPAVIYSCMNQGRGVKDYIMSYHLVQWGTEYYPFYVKYATKGRRQDVAEMTEWMHGSDICVWFVSVTCEAKCSKCLNWWHNAYTINLMVQKVQEHIFLESSHFFCLTSPGDVGCWHAESTEGHPYNKSYMKVSASSQKSWDRKWKKKFMFRRENIIWWRKTLSRKSRHITDNLCMYCSKIAYCCWHCSQR